MLSLFLPCFAPITGRNGEPPQAYSSVSPTPIEARACSASDETTG